MADTIQKVASINSSIKLELGDSLRKLKLFKKELKSVKQMLDKMPSKSKMSAMEGSPSKIKQQNTELKKQLDLKKKLAQEELKDLKFVNKQEKINAKEREKINDRTNRLIASGDRRATFAGIDKDSPTGQRIRALREKLRANAKTSRSYRDLAKHVDRYNQGLNQVIGTHKRMSASSQSTAAKLNRLRTGFLALTAAATPFAVGQSVFEIGQNVEKLGLGLSISFGDETQSQMQKFNQIVDETGVRFSAAAKSYRNFMVSSNETGFSIKESERIFKTFAKASAVMGMSAEDTEGTLRA